MKPQLPASRVFFVRMFMILPPDRSAKNYIAFAAAAILLLFGGIGLFIFAHYFVLRCLSIIAIMASTHFTRVAKTPAHSLLRPERRLPLTRALRMAGSILLIIDCCSAYAMYLDATHGYHHAWPLYLFFAGGVCSIPVFGYILASFM